MLKTNPTSIFMLFRGILGDGLRAACIMIVWSGLIAVILFLATVGGGFCYLLKVSVLLSRPHPQ